MADRILLETGRMIISQPGYNASPSLADANKVFDSDWAFGGAIITAGVKQFTVEDTTSGYYTIDFPTALDYVPAVILNVVDLPTMYDGSPALIGVYRNWGPYFSNRGGVTTFASVTNSQIRIPKFNISSGTFPTLRLSSPATSPPYPRCFAIEYTVFAV
ncbi:hypothetical protein [Mesorhizobium sp. 8]|uniref:hypothetical protein n=1 Tax=Mesorhizobium sp. 8 TaxID=2584466 RepID=UPI00111F616E|nr:hypothetical protein [Mesorhizobium sp. 8]QDC00344.1 hypothetical protein FGU64_07905 [Mesorhizobium sp. 8]